MKTQFFVNETAHTMFLGGLMIAPGEGRDVPVMFLPASQQPEAETASPPSEPNLDELLAELLAKPVKQLVTQLPELTHEALARLDELESATATPRKTLLAAVAAEQLRRVAELNASLDDGETLTDAERLARSEADFQAELDAQAAAQLASLNAEQRAALGEGGAAGTEAGQG